MKKFRLLILLLVIPLGSVSILAASTYKEHDNVTLKETTLYGDRSAANGLNVNQNVNLYDNLYWNTAVQFTDKLTASTDYSFYPIGHHMDAPKSYEGISFMCYPEIGDIDSSAAQPGLTAAYQELFNTLEPGEEKEKTVFLKDYMDYYEFEISFDFPNCANFGNTTALLSAESDTLKTDLTLIALQDIKDYFKIPVLDTETHVVSVGKHVNGYLATSGGGTGDGERFYMESFSVTTDNTCYFTFKPKSTEGNLVDLSELPDGYGIFSLPYERVSDVGMYDLQTVKTDQISMVYPLDPNVEIYGLAIDESKTKLFLYTIEEEQLWITVIDAASMTDLQKFILCDMGSDTWPTVYNYTDFLAVFNHYSEKISVFSLNEQQRYEHRFTCDWYPKNYTAADHWYPDNLAYNGTSLACVNNVRQYSSKNSDYCDFYISIYTSDGLQYQGLYENSLDSGIDNDWYDYPCRCDFYNPNKISWK